MVVTEVLGNIKHMELGVVKREAVLLEWYEGEKKLLKKTSSSGEEIGIRVETPLKDGDVLYKDNNRVIFVEIQPTDLLHISVYSMQEMGRLCFELGNRHLSLGIHNEYVQVPYDEPTFEYLKKLGFDVKKCTEKFSNYTVCHAHSHSHNHGHNHVHGHTYE